MAASYGGRLVFQNLSNSYKSRSSPQRQVNNAAILSPCNFYEYYNILFSTTT